MSQNFYEFYSREEADEFAAEIGGYVALEKHYGIAQDKQIYCPDGSSFLSQGGYLECVSSLGNAVKSLYLICD
jgi:hypothetical protein